MQLRIFSVKKQEKGKLLKSRLIYFSNDCLRANPNKYHHLILKYVQSKTKCPVQSATKTDLERVMYKLANWVLPSSIDEKKQKKNRMHGNDLFIMTEILL